MFFGSYSVNKLTQISILACAAYDVVKVRYKNRFGFIFASRDNDELTSRVLWRRKIGHVIVLQDVIIHVRANTNLR